MSRLTTFAIIIAGALSHSGMAFAQNTSDGDLAKRGEYLTRAADCEACHTVPGDKPYVGGRAFELPFGVIYSPNITPDKKTGIGSWSDDEFVRALHEGIGKNGEHLYPAFPYASYTGMSREDALAIKAYLFSLPPIENAAKANRLSFPFNQRWGMAFWNVVNLTNKRFESDPKQSDDWNRGNYLANALGHCGECHTPRTLSFGLDSSRPFAGAEIEGWRAYNLTSDKEHGLGSWSDGQLEAYLSTGHAEGRGAAAGPMEEVVRLSLSHLTTEDVRALGVYLRALPPQSTRGDPVVNADPPELRQAGYVPSGTQSSLGQAVFEGACASCHGWDGSGMQTPYAALKGSGAVNDLQAMNLVQVVLKGASANTAAGEMRMPAFGKSLSDAEIAAVANYVVDRFGGQQASVSPKDVQKLRLGPAALNLEPYINAAFMFAVVAMLIIAVVILTRRRARPEKSRPNQIS
ncbi:mono/diheme cytochrome c family protein [Phyllobacterium sp. 1468]|uniref:c-type cytochrome n=1 Tax=Phyllobacterium sp. 1468 TaxID=2817759 RepID=UPI00286353E9|nr:c-type cytochrome [Phyllobacterium sp. 1468]MDR6632613.1 mono/diheme cytochrome c family protein [Phyllobacterium sp. 1468]